MRNIEPMQKPVRIRSEGSELRHQRRLNERTRQGMRNEARQEKRQHDVQ